MKLSQVEKMGDLNKNYDDIFDNYIRSPKELVLIALSGVKNFDQQNL